MALLSLAIFYLISWFPEKRVERILKDEGDQSADVSGVTTILVAEALDHEMLFGGYFHPARGNADEHCEKAAHEAVLKSRAHETCDHAGVNGVADDAIGTAHDERVVLLDGWGGAPVFAESETRPAAESDSAKHKCKTN